jgi:ribosomal-protein-alanine N-acetyltransferase
MNHTFPILTSERTTLRQIKEADLPYIYEGLSHPEIIKYYGVSYDSLEATKEQMDWFANLEKTGEGIWWAICSRSDGIFLGAGGLNNLSQEHKKAEVGFWLLRPHWSKGYMTETMPVILDYAFHEIGLHRVEGFVETNNINCKKALDKLQFIHEGTMVDCEVKNGAFISLDIYAKFSTKQ